MDELALEGFSEKVPLSLTCSVVFVLVALGAGGIFGAGSPHSAIWYLL